MSEPLAERFRVILGKSRQAARPVVSGEFARLFGVAESLAEQIVQAAPIVVLSDLSRDQAMEIVQALQPLRAKGGDLRIEISDDKSISQVAWPAPPKIAGKELSEFDRPSGQDGSILCCPECGARLQVSLASTKPATPNAAPAPNAEEKPVPPAEPALPEHDLGGGVMSTGLTPPPMRAVPPSSGGEDLVFDNLQPLSKGTGSYKPVGDVKEFETTFQQAVGAHEGEEETSGGGDEAPTLQETSREALEVNTGPQPSVERETGPYSVVIAKTGNPQAIPLLAEDLGISDEKVRNQMKKPMIAVAKGVSKKSAIAIAARYKAIGINPRIGRRK